MYKGLRGGVQDIAIKQVPRLAFLDDIPAEVSALHPDDCSLASGTSITWIKVIKVTFPIAVAGKMADDYDQHSHLRANSGEGSETTHSSVNTCS